MGDGRGGGGVGEIGRRDHQRVLQGREARHGRQAGARLRRHHARRVPQRGALDRTGPTQTGVNHTYEPLPDRGDALAGDVVRPCQLPSAIRAVVDETRVALLK
ncbi:hypothetical protein GCM10010228_49160 [Streptomyces massasporeus]|nr:hypothetical protein GCM10010228_49160 [Streptomyces massasporeus]